MTATTLYPLPQLPFQDPVLIVATASLIFLVVPLLFERLRVPGIIGLILVGAAVGPNGVHLDEETARELANVVVRNEEQFSSEIVPGVVLPHVRLAGLAHPLLVLGVSREGVRFPRAADPARLIFLLVSPAERAEEHLRYLAEIARLLSTPGKAEEIVERFAPGAALDWMHVDD